MTVSIKRLAFKHYTRFKKIQTDISGLFGSFGISTGFQKITIFWMSSALFFTQKLKMNLVSLESPLNILNKVLRLWTMFGWAVQNRNELGTLAASIHDWSEETTWPLTRRACAVNMNTEQSWPVTLNSSVHTTGLEPACVCLCVFVRGCKTVWLLLCVHACVSVRLWVYTNTFAWRS